MASETDLVAETSAKIDAEYAVWFEKLEAVAGKKLNPDDWFGRWFDYYTPKQAWEDGPEDPTMPPTVWI
jgi:hypothetical protein